MKLKNCVVGMKVKIKSKHAVPFGGGQAEDWSLGHTGTITNINYEVGCGLSLRIIVDGGQPEISIFSLSSVCIDHMNHNQVKQINKSFNPKIGDSVYVDSSALKSGVKKSTVESVVTCTGDGYSCTDGEFWLRSDLSSYRKPREGDRINSACLTLDTIKVGMKVRTLEGTSTARKAGHEYVVTRFNSTGRGLAVELESTKDGGSQIEYINYLTKSW